MALRRADCVSACGRLYGIPNCGSRTGIMRATSGGQNGIQSLLPTFFGARSFISPAPQSTNTPPEDASMEVFIDNLHLKHKIRSDTKAKIDSRMSDDRRAADDHRLAKLQKSRNPFKSVDTKSVSALFVKEDVRRRPSVPVKPQRLKSPEEEYRKLQEWDKEGVSLPEKELMYAVGFFATVGHVEGVRLVQKLLKEHHEDLYRSEIRLEHYLANALANAKEYSASCELFKRLFYDYPVKRQKLSNMFRFTIVRVLNEYPAIDTLPLIYNFVEFAMKLNEFMPALHFWQALFQHSSPAANTEANQLLEQYHRLKKMVRLKLDSLMIKSREVKDTTFLFRLLTLLDSLDLPEKDLKHFTGCLYDAIMDVYCSHEDLVGAKQLIKLAEDRAKISGKVSMWPDTMKRYVKASGLVKVAVATADWRSGTNPAERVVKFKF
ncbi:hypothetical protein RvY_05986 [Ramazzottius varieornatus]|uniref:Uncharacterized protein n=1 Tax=Ramazzottius varieornatus TaxID=947166 RepID=A0A1D1UXG7_RAMVA|nr:hypothetical protein RvY_05986 [Ramazzottius varieornatus]